MPVRPDDFPRNPSATIAEDRLCRGCKYNLRGLSEAGKCPECGRPIKKPRERPRFVDQMIQAPLSWIKAYRRGTLLLCLGAWTMSLGLLGWLLAGYPGFGVLATLGAIAWAAGSVIATRPRPRTKGTEFDPKTEWRVERLAARWSQPAWALAIGGALGVQASGSVGLITVIPLGLLILVGVMGWWPLLMLQSNLAYWASDTELADRLRISSWAPAVGMGMGLAMLAVAGGRSGGAFAGVVALVSVFFFLTWAGLLLVSMGYFLVSIWQLQRMAHWAAISHITNDMRDERLRERARRAAPPPR